MDFVSIASAFTQYHRYLHEGDGEDDMLGDYEQSSASIPISSPGTSAEYLGAENLPDGSTQPLLSRAAEAELFLLATNFLLYVAMVIITTMIAKIYFPETLTPREPTGTRATSYVRVEDNNASYYSDTDDEEKVPMIEEEVETPRSPPEEKTKGGKTFDFLDFEQSTASKMEVVKRLLFCSLMLNVTFVTWGLLQERMLTRRYPRFTGEYFTYSYFLVFSNRLWTFVMSGLLMLYIKPHASKSTVIYEYSFPAISNMLSSWCQYEALKFVTFPAQTIFKSFKLVPVMVMGKILGNKDYPQYDYFVATVIGFGIALFMKSTDNLNFGYNTYDNNSESWTGIMLLLFFLFFDSFTGQWQSRMFQRHRDLSIVELLFATSAFSTVLSLITLVHENELGAAFDFIMEHYEIHGHIFVFSVCSTIGQLFIYYTIKNFGAVVFALIMTTRILLSIALSCIIYGHKVTPIGFAGLSLVIGAVLYRIKRKAEGTQLIKWEGMADDKAQELVQEWHEHLDT